jgi:septum formation protein
VISAGSVRQRLILASASPARLATLRAAGIEPEVVVSGVDEDAYVEGTPAELALTLARAKARAVAARQDVTSGVVIGCDSVLDLDGVALGKPADAAEAVARWRQMRGRSGVLSTGHWVVDVEPGHETGATASTVVHFADVSDDEIDAYVATGEPLRVAGAFTIDGLGGAFVSRIEGDHHTVVGLSLPLVRELLLDLGHRWPTFWAAS